MDEEKYWCEEILKAAESRIPGCFSASFFQMQNISIVDQQARSLNLSYALTRLKRVSQKSHVAVIGGGVSGLTCAAALALASNCMVYVFERDEMLMRKFREAGFRYFHPELNPSGGHAQGGITASPYKRTPFPIMNWQGGYGPELAEQLLRSFSAYRSVANISMHLGTHVTAIRRRGGQVSLRADRKLLTFDTVILATGFGPEKGESNLTNDESYWHSGNPSGYRALPNRTGRARERVLISGNGDSGVIELASFLIKDFAHHQVLGLMPSNRLARRLGLEFDASQQTLTFPRILNDVLEDPDSGEPQAIGSYARYWNLRALRSAASDVSFIPLEAAIFEAYDEHLRQYRAASEVPIRVAHALTQSVDGLLSDLASKEIATFIRAFDLRKVFDETAVRRLLRTDVHVEIIGRTPTIYSRRQAPLNWFLLRLLEKYANFKYRKGEFRPDACTVKQNQVMTQFGTFDRLVVRHGPKFEEVLGYSDRVVPKSPALLASRFDQMLLHRKVDRTGSRPIDAFSRHFRGKLWWRARRVGDHFEDFEDAERQISTLVADQPADNFLLMLHGTSSAVEAEKWYRLFKSAGNFTQRKNAITKLLELVQQHVKATNQTGTPSSKSPKKAF